jgi:hypothetical protein
MLLAEKVAKLHSSSIHGSKKASVGSAVGFPMVKLWEAILELALKDLYSCPVSLAKSCPRLKAQLWLLSEQAEQLAHLLGIDLEPVRALPWCKHYEKRKWKLEEILSTVSLQESQESCAQEDLVREGPHKVKF